VKHTRKRKREVKVDYKQSFSSLPLVPIACQVYFATRQIPILHGQICQQTTLPLPHVRGPNRPRVGIDGHPWCTRHLLSCCLLQH
jgi:hypothetical protein